MYTSDVNGLRIYYSIWHIKYYYIFAHFCEHGRLAPLVATCTPSTGYCMHKTLHNVERVAPKRVTRTSTNQTLHAILLHCPREQSGTKTSGKSLVLRLDLYSYNAATRRFSVRLLQRLVHIIRKMLIRCRVRRLHRRLRSNAECRA